MDRDAIIAFLKENLSVDVNVGRECDFGTMSLTIKVSVMLDGETISTGSDFINVSELQ